MRIFISILIAGFFYCQNISSAAIQLKFDLKFGIIRGGEAILTITDTTYRGVKAIKYHIQGRTTGITEKLFSVHDIYETIVDAKTNLPLRTIRNVKEQKYKRYNEIEFYQDQDSIFSLRKGGKKVPHNLLDIISVFFYFVRNNYLERADMGESEIFKVFNTESKTDEIRIKHSGITTINSEIGDVKCYCLIPWMEKGKVLKRSDGMRCYISIDNKIPIQLEFELKVGTLKAVLKSYDPGGSGK